MRFRFKLVDADPEAVDIWSLPESYVAPGEVLLTADARCITTLLGSCVAIAFHCPRPRLSALCHALLPSAQRWGARPQAGKFRFVDQAVLEMAQAFERHGIEREQIQVKIFGGAHVLRCDSTASFDVGLKNIEEAERSLAALGFTVKARAVGGERGRKVHFNTVSGEVLVRSLGMAA